MMTRRDFLGRAAAGAGFASMAGGIPGMWLDVAAAVEATKDQPVLVVVDLEGGNDGLNTVVPYANDIYHRSRPNLRIDPKKVKRLDDYVGLHPAMMDLYSLWESGRCAIVQNVGYPEPNRSHFKSREIWQSGGAPVPRPSGWIGRTTDRFPKWDACHVGEGAAPLALEGRRRQAVSIASISDCQLESGARLAVPNGGRSDSTLQQIRERYQAAEMFLNRLSKAADEVDGSSGSSKTLTGKLEMIRTLIKHDRRLRFFYTSIGGFDTHINQWLQHENLLGEVSSALKQFVDGLRSDGLQERVLVLVISEFGRRLKENGQAGTDHGAAAPLFVVGDVVRAGLLGDAPDLQNLDGIGDIRYQIDFRDVYATVLRQWLGIDPAPILGDRDESLALLRGHHTPGRIQP